MYCSSSVQLTERTISIHHYDASWMEGDRKRFHDRNVRLNRIFGDKAGNKISKMLEDAEYIAHAVNQRMNKD